MEHWDERQSTADNTGRQNKINKDLKIKIGRSKRSSLKFSCKVWNGSAFAWQLLAPQRWNEPTTRQESRLKSQVSHSRCSLPRGVPWWRDDILAVQKAPFAHEQIKTITIIPLLMNEQVDSDKLQCHHTIKPTLLWVFSLNALVIRQNLPRFHSLLIVEHWSTYSQFYRCRVFF
jgi:hypothetical protein